MQRTIDRPQAVDMPEVFEIEALPATWLTTGPLTADAKTADAKPFWSALCHSLTLADTEDYEYRRSSIYNNVGAMCRINNDG